MHSQRKRGKYLEKENILCKGEDKRRRNLEKGNIFFAEEKKNGEGRGGKYLDKESIILL